MTTGFPINPPGAPIGAINGTPIFIDPVWYRYFLAIQKVIGGPVSPFDDGALLATSGSGLVHSKQDGDPTLDALAELDATPGLLTQTGADAFIKRTLTAPAAGFSITNPAGTAGNPTFVLADDLAALEGLGSTGLAARTASNTWAQRTLTAPAAGFTITNPAGVAGDPTFVLANDLAALEALSGTNTIYYRSAADTWTAVTIGAGLGFSGGTLAVALTLASTVAQSGTPVATSVGFLGSPQMADQDDYTLALTDAGGHYYHVSGSTHTLTIPANASVSFPIGTVIGIVNENGGGALSIAITSDTLRWGSSTGTRTLAADGTATLLKVAATVWRLTGDGIT